MNRARIVALRSTCHSHQHGCVIVRDDEIIAEGFNHTRTRLFHKFSVHAEVDALSKLPHNRAFLSKCDMYVVRIGTLGMGLPIKFSKPCVSCATAIHKSGIRRVFYAGIQAE